MKFTLGVLITLISLVIIFLIFIYSGWYNVSAMNEDSGLMKWIFKTTMNNSVESRSKDITVPDLNDSSIIAEGFEHYNEMCVDCHGAPGIEESELSKGLNPRAPYLVEVANRIDSRELFWATKNGIRMTGMPAWGKTHSDDKIWAIVAFIKTLPNISADAYNKMGTESNKVEEDDNHHKDEQHNHSQMEGEDHH
jgi:mono/diheme cytochrome c family protein